MISIKKILSAASLIAASVIAAPSVVTASAQSHHSEELAGGHKKADRSHHDRSYRNDGHRRNDSDRRHDGHRRNDNYNRQWKRADHYYQRHHNTHKRYSNTHYTDRRPIHHRKHYDRGWSNHRNYDGYYRRKARSYNTRHSGHYHRGNDHLYCPDHSGSRYYIGGRYDRFGSSVTIGDYHRYGLYDPPRGHRWVRDRDNSDAILASVATGAIIGLVVGAIIADGDDHHRDRGYKRRRY